MERQKNTLYTIYIYIILNCQPYFKTIGKNIIGLEEIKKKNRIQNPYYVLQHTV